METERIIAYPDNFIKYIGTGGGRFSMICQKRSTGGLWLQYGGLKGVIDPGPGSLARICATKPELLPDSIDFVILTHKHLDHSTDANVLIECMTHGGFDKRGILVAPNDALDGDDPVILKYAQRKAAAVEIPRDGVPIDIGGGVTAEPVTHVHHGVECFGYIFKRTGIPDWGLISDAKPMAEYFAQRYSSCMLVSINTTFPNKKPRLDHTSLEDVRELLEKLHPKRAILTHLGAMLTSEEGSQFFTCLDTRETLVTAASDGMVVDLDTLDIYDSRQDLADRCAILQPCANRIIKK